MSRVDEAKRRAARMADAAPAPPDEFDLTFTSEGADVRELAREPFPLEVAERRTHHPAPPVADVVRFAPIIAEAPRPAAVAQEPAQPGSLFERIDRSLAEKIVIDSHMESNSREQYRRLAATLHQAQGTTGLKVVMIASAAPGEGKTLTASNLALTLSESYRRHVLLVDGDLRRPALHTIFRLDNAGGLSEGLTHPTMHRLPVRQVSECLAVLPAGSPTSDPMAGLTSERMRRLIEEARQSFDWVIIDTPPVALLPDANLLASMVDGAVLVVKAGATPYALVQRAILSLGRERILGTVLNRAEPGGSSYGYYNAYYGSRPRST